MEFVKVAKCAKMILAYVYHWPVVEFVAAVVRMKHVWMEYANVRTVESQVHAMCVMTIMNASMALAHVFFWVAMVVADLVVRMKHV